MSIDAMRVVESAGCTYRQLDYWTRKGLVHAVEKDSPGSGFRRRYADEEADVISLMAKLVKVGFDPDVAVVLARTYTPGSEIDLGHGLVILVKDLTSSLQDDTIDSIADEPE